MVDDLALVRSGTARARLSRVWDRPGGGKLAGEFYSALSPYVYCLLGICLADFGFGSYFRLALESEPVPATTSGRLVQVAGVYRGGDCLYADRPRTRDVGRFSEPATLVPDGNRRHSPSLSWKARHPFRLSLFSDFA